MRQRLLWDCLLEVKDIFDSVGCPFFLLGGTLLGFVREGDIIRGDNDLDIGVFEENEGLLDAAIERAKQLGWHTRDWYDEAMYDNKGRYVAFYNDKFRTGDKLNHLDVFVCYRHKKDMWFGVSLFGKCYIESYPLEMVEELGTITVKEVTFNVPRLTDDFLKRAYGNWKVPDSKWENLTSYGEIRKGSSFDNNLIQEMGIRILLGIMSPRDIKFVKEGFDKMDYVDKLWVKYFGPREALNEMFKYFYKHTEYTHLIIHSDDAVPSYEAVAMLIADIKKYRFKIISGVVAMDFLTKDNRLSATFKPVTDHEYLREESYYCLPFEFTKLNGIVKVWFQGYALTIINREILEPVTKLMWTLPEHTLYDLPHDILLALACHKLNIEQYIDLRVWYWHYRHPCKPARLGTDGEDQWFLKVGLLPSKVTLVRAVSCVTFREAGELFTKIPQEYKKIYKESNDKMMKALYDKFVKYFKRYITSDIPPCPPINGPPIYDENFKIQVSWSKWYWLWGDFQSIIRNPKLYVKAKEQAKRELKEEYEAKIREIGPQQNAHPQYEYSNVPQVKKNLTEQMREEYEKAKSKIPEGKQGPHP